MLQRDALVSTQREGIASLTLNCVPLSKLGRSFEAFKRRSVVLQMGKNVPRGDPG